MPLQPLQLNIENHCYLFLQKLSAAQQIRIAGSKQRYYIVADERKLSRQLLLATDGSTYWRNDILQLTETEAAAQIIYFPTVDSQVKHLLDVKHAIKNKHAKTKFVFNVPLAATIISMRFMPGICLSISPPICQFGGRSFPVIFPTLSPCGSTYEYFELEKWLDYLTLKQKNLVYPYPHKEISLQKNAILPNHALAQILRLHFQIQQQFKHQLEIQITNNLPAINKDKLRRMIKSRKEMLLNYRDSILVQREYYQKSIQQLPLLLLHNASDVNSLFPQFKFQRQQLNQSLMQTYAWDRVLACSLIHYAPVEIFILILGIALHFNYSARTFCLLEPKKLVYELFLFLIYEVASLIVACASFIATVNFHFMLHSGNNAHRIKLSDGLKEVDKQEKQALQDHYTEKLNYIQERLDEISFFEQEPNKKLKALYAEKQRFFCQLPDVKKWVHVQNDKKKQLPNSIL